MYSVTTPARRQSGSYLSRWSVKIFLMAALVCPALPARAGDAPPDVQRSLVRIAATSVTPDYLQPWNPGSTGGGVGTGFVIDGRRILTNAHVISNTKFLVVERESDPKQYTARVKYVAHDSDLALLELDDPTFFENTPALEFGAIPELESTVAVYGYPLGGDRASVTTGVVSRIDFLPYSHSVADSHLAIQIDAAINPGNSGGPVMQQGRVVGVAFQGFSGAVAQNVGFMIPVPVIRRFLADIADGSYDRYVDLAVSYFKLQNPAQRRALGLANDDRGVLISRVLTGGSCDGKLENGDVLVALNGHPVASDGFVDLDGKRVEMPEIVERKLKGEQVALDVIRSGQSVRVDVDLQPAWQFAQQSARYDVLPRYVVFGGLVFQPLGRELMESMRIEDMRIRYFHEFYVTDQLYVDRPEIVLLSNILPDPVNTYLMPFRLTVVDEINGRKIRTLRDVSEALKMDVPTHVIRVIGTTRPIVFEAAAVAQARDRIRTRYNINREENLDEKNP